MDPKTRYMLALGAFAQQVRILCASARELDAAAREFDPEGTAPDDPIVVNLFAQCAGEMRAMCANLVGMRQLFYAALSKE